MLFASKKTIERFVLAKGNWVFARHNDLNRTAGQKAANTIASMPVVRLSAGQRALAIDILKNKYRITAKSITSKSMQGSEVLRVENDALAQDAKKLRLLLCMAAPASWEKTIKRSEGIEQPALSLDIDGEPQEYQLYLKGLLASMDIQSEIKVSHSPSMKDKTILRVTGRRDIDKLRQAIPTLGKSGVKRPLRHRHAANGRALAAS